MSEIENIENRIKVLRNKQVRIREIINWATRFEQLPNISKWCKDNDIDYIALCHIRGDRRNIKKELFDRIDKALTTVGV